MRQAAVVFSAVMAVRAIVYDSEAGLIPAFLLPSVDVISHETPSWQGLLNSNCFEFFLKGVLQGFSDASGEWKLANISLIRDRVFTLIEPLLEDSGYELVEVEYLSMHGRWILRLYIDREGGVTIDDCVDVSRELGDIIEVKEIIGHEYILEVSSPGLNRPLRREKDFIKAIGNKIKLKMNRDLDGQKNFTGILKDYNKRIVFLETGGSIIELPFDNIEKSNLLYDFNDNGAGSVNSTKNGVN